MSVISVLNQKGGVGKTTLCVNIASKLNSDGHSVLIVDLDPQQSATDWSSASDEAGVTVVSMSKNITKDLPRLANQFDYVLIDGAPQVAELSAMAIKLSDCVLIPCQPSPLDVWACGDLVDVIKTRQEITDGKPKSAFIINAAIRGTKLSNEVVSALSEYELPIMETKIFRSVNFAEVMKTGSSVINLPKNNVSRKEIESLVTELKGFL